ncbi:hypothetical protein JZU68_09595, partial [bacterium]|nr:hypothetical protein [bacterium]
MFDEPLRRLKDRIGRPLANLLSGISPTAISMLALVVGLLASFAAYRNQYVAALGLWILNRVL